MCDDATNDDASFRQVQEHTFSPENQSFAVQPFLAQAHSWFDPDRHAIDVDWLLWFVGEDVICCEVFGIPLQGE